MTGSDFQQAARWQVTSAGAELRDVEVTGIDRREDGRFDVRPDDGELTADHARRAARSWLDRLGLGTRAEARRGRRPTPTVGP
jgi:glycine/D-amino acid oxidase-like deaminating enzyme